MLRRTGGTSPVLSTAVVTIVACLLLWPLVLKTVRNGYFYLTDVTWAGDEAVKRQQSRFHISKSEFEQVPSWVVSLTDSVDRRSAVLASFRRENVTFEFADAIQSSSGLPANDVERFVSTKLERATRQGKRAPIVRAETAAALSHLRLLDRAVQQRRKAVAQFEDDVYLLPDFKARALQLLNLLPEDWDFVYLSDCQITDAWSSVGKHVGKGVLTLRRGPCTTGFAYRPSGAAKVLQYVQIHRLSTPFDVLLDNLASAKRINMYTTAHRLAKPARVASIIQHPSSKNQTLL